MQKRLDPEMGVNRIFEMFSCQGRIQKFFQGGDRNLRHFSSVVVFDRFNVSNFA